MPEPSPQDLGDAIVDAQRMIARVGDSVARLQDTLGRPSTGADLPLLVELFALHADAAGCAGTARSKREAVAFTALASRLERLIAGRGGALVRPEADSAFDPAVMEASEVVATDDPALDRTVERVIAPGLLLAESRRSVRPARVVVRRGDT